MHYGTMHLKGGVNFGINTGRIQRLRTTAASAAVNSPTRLPTSTSSTFSLRFNLSQTSTRPTRMQYANSTSSQTSASSNPSSNLGIYNQDKVRQATQVLKALLEPINIPVQQLTPPSSESSDQASIYSYKEPKVYLSNWGQQSILFSEVPLSTPELSDTPLEH